LAAETGVGAPIWEASARSTVQLLQVASHRFKFLGLQRLGCSFSRALIKLQPGKGELAV